MNNQQLEIAGVTEREVQSYYMKLRGRKLTVALAFVAGTGFTLFGFLLLLMIHLQHAHIAFSSYDQGVMSALLTANQVS